MTLTISQPKTTTTASASTSRRVRPVWQVGGAAALVAAVATTLVALAAKAVDVPMKAAPRTEEVGRAIPMSGFAISTIMCTAVGVLIALALYRWATRPARIFVAVTVLLTLASFAGPITTGHATTATRLVLALTHVVAAAIVIPAVARRLAV
jgi:hypothetical protein